MVMLKTRLTELLGIKHPIIQAGMGPFSNNNLCVARRGQCGNTRPVLHERAFQQSI
jgi:NAD(P)H-dependent flavin oxidoreductase YrpB (nitropropane dioxygenase family)